MKGREKEREGLAFYQVRMRCLRKRIRERADIRVRRIQ